MDGADLPGDDRIPPGAHDPLQPHRRLRGQLDLDRDRPVLLKDDQIGPMPTTLAPRHSDRNACEWLLAERLDPDKLALGQNVLVSVVLTRPDRRGRRSAGRDLPRLRQIAATGKGRPDQRISLRVA